MARWRLRGLKRVDPEPDRRSESQWVDATTRIGRHSPAPVSEARARMLSAAPRGPEAAAETPATRPGHNLLQSNRRRACELACSRSPLWTGIDCAGLEDARERSLAGRGGIYSGRGRGGPGVVAGHVARREEEGDHRLSPTPSPNGSDPWERKRRAARARTDGAWSKHGPMERARAAQERHWHPRAGAGGAYGGGAGRVVAT